VTNPNGVHDLAVTHYPVAELRTYHKNPRVGNVDRIADSLRVNGQFKPIVVNTGTHTGRPLEVLAGNHTLKAARDLAWDTISAVTVDVDDDQAARIVLADNRTGDLGTYDDRLLAELLTELPTLEGTGYDPGDLDAIVALLEDLNDNDFGNDEDILDATDKASWPIIRAQVPPDIYDRFQAIDGDDDAQRIRVLLDMAGVA
jgi:ParB-like chromosome segregation protein Spo0J